MKTYLKLSDEELIRFYLNGDIKSFTVLMNKYKARIYTSIYLLVKDKYLAEDIFQETFIKILDKLHTDEYADVGKFMPWAMRIARNLCIDHFRKVKRKPPIVSGDGQNIFNVIKFEAPIEDKITDGDREYKISKLLEMLPEDQREVIIMRHYADLSFKEIAAITNCSINTALGRMRYGLLNLRRMVAEKQITLGVMGISFYSLQGFL